MKRFAILFALAMTALPAPVQAECPGGTCRIERVRVVVRNGAARLPVVRRVFVSR